MDMGQNPIPLVNIKIAGKWMFIPLKMVLIGIDSYPYNHKSCVNMGVCVEHTFFPIHIFQFGDSMG